ncbi:membrane protein of ER body 2-like [Coffea arabica]|uniref:Membrane protein of ER body 2-like n=1 Tax=Coffea arabica TaxID=13443 RepID=A0A6P6WGE2_COFAR|nr:membrane protein of ER body 2-like [Coffea arabica]
MEVVQQLRTGVEKRKEVLHHFKEEVEEAVEEALLQRRRSANIPTAAANSGGNATVFPAAEEVAAVDLLDTTPKMEVVSGSVEGDQKVEKTSEEIVYFDKNEGSGLEWSHSNVKVEESGSAKLKHVQIDPVLPVISGKAVRQQPSTSPQLQEETHERAEVDDVLEFESGEEEIEVEFERAVEKIHSHDDYNMYCPHCSSRITKVVLRRKMRPRMVPIPSPTPTQRHDLFGCLSCFKIFICSGNRLKSLNPFRCFGAGKGPDSTPPLQPGQQSPGASMPTSGTTQDKDVIKEPKKSDSKGDYVTISLGNTQPGEGKAETIAPSQSSRSLEIVRSIVYGGLMESIASLSVVSSAAASDATTLNIVALGLANLVGGLVVLAHNLWDLRYGDSSETNESRYEEQLGRKEHFSLHAMLAVLSYLVFGLIPPVIYGFTFRESDDRDYKILAVAAASLLCIVILAMAKAYTRGEHKVMAYFKTILYYVISAVMASGIAYAVGDLVNKLLERLGWLNPATVEPQLFSQAKSFNPTSTASY